MLGTAISIFSFIKGPWMKYGVVVLLSLGLLYAGHRYSYNLGVTEAELQYAIDIQNERDRIGAVNEAASKRAQVELDRLEEVIRVRDAEITRILNEAAKDVDADRGAISIDSVRRINTVR